MTSVQSDCTEPGTRIDILPRKGETNALPLVNGKKQCANRFGLHEQHRSGPDTSKRH